MNLSFSPMFESAGVFDNDASTNQFEVDMAALLAIVGVCASAGWLALGPVREWLALLPDCNEDFVYF